MVRAEPNLPGNQATSDDNGKKIDPVTFFWRYNTLVMIALAFALVADSLPYGRECLSFAMVAVAVLLWVRHSSERVRLGLLLMSIVITLRFLIWRTLFTLNFDTVVDGTASVLLYLAELYTAQTFLGYYFKTVKLDRSPDLVPPDPSFTPSVDVFIPTYNEPIDILRRTICGATEIDYPNKTVYVLDDGRRETVQQLAEELGCKYITRPDNKHFKAGNINNALPQTNGELILFLDADHIPATSILYRTVHFFKDPKVALVQTPHRFVNPGPVERNLLMEGKMPGEQELFYQIVHVGMNFWNSSFFCGSAAVIRRSYLLEVGGVAVETVTEDCETSLKLHARGYKSVFYSVPQAVGLSPESIAGYFIQQIRWARGSAQMLRVCNPMFMKGLTWPQRINYFNGMTYFFYGLPRLVFFLAPVGYLIFGIYPIHVSYIDYVIMGIPFLLITMLYNNYTFGNFRHSFWSDVYQTILSPFLAYVTTIALFNPRTGKFVVTPKGDKHAKITFQFRLALPNIILLVLCVIALLFGVYGLCLGTRTRELEGILINEFWNTYNILILVCSILVALERTLTRRAHRVHIRLPVSIQLPDSSQERAGLTEDLTEFGALVRLDASRDELQDTRDVLVTIEAPAGDPIRVKCDVSRKESRKDGQQLIGLQFSDVDGKKMRSLIRLVYCDEGTWSQLREPRDSLGRSIWTLITTAARVLTHLRR